jgi:hypothetical protein
MRESFTVKESKALNFWACFSKRRVNTHSVQEFPCTHKVFFPSVSQCSALPAWDESVSNRDIHWELGWFGLDKGDIHVTYYVCCCTRKTGCSKLYNGQEKGLTLRDGC